MKFIPILFSTPMVIANLEGRKTVTRGIITPQPIDNTEVDGNFFEGNHKGYVKVDGHSNWREQFAFEFSKYQTGDVLWVRETWEDYQGAYNYKAGKYGLLDEKWKPSIFMPKAACRLFLEVVSVRPERLQDITEEDAIREGVNFISDEFGYAPYGKYAGIGPMLLSAKESFASLWQSINREESCNSNPWVWRIEFKKINKPENFNT